MKIVEINHYQSRYFPNLTDENRDKKTFYNLTHAQRGDRKIWYGIIKTLFSYSNTVDEIIDVILKYNTCGYSDQVKTRAMVEEFVSEGTNNNGKLYKDRNQLNSIPSESPERKLLVFNGSLDYLSYFLRHYGIPGENIPANPREAAFYHISRGRIPLPRFKDTKQVYLKHRSPGADRFKWKRGGCDYSKLIMTKNDIYDSWDYSNGICLIVPTDWRDDVYLDIDMRSDKHPLGLEKLDESILQGYHWERTQNGGYHLFGKGRPQKPPIPSEIQIVSTLIVTFPTNGYSLK